MEGGIIVKSKSPNGFCPILAGLSACDDECKHDCAWFNPTAMRCDINVIADFVLRNPDIMEILEERLPADTEEE